MKWLILIVFSSSVQAVVDRQLDFCSPDFDENGRIEASSDGLRVFNYLMGLSDLAKHWAAEGALIHSQEAFKAKLMQSGCQSYLDVDGNGQLDGLTDGLLFFRWTAGFRGQDLIDGAIGANATRTTAEQIEAHLNQPLLNPPMAARFLTQASFGPSAESIDQLVHLEGGLNAWLEQQFNLPYQPQLNAVKELTRKMCFYPEEADTWFSPARHQIWWQRVIQGEDQLRQRVAFALSQILVISDQAPNVDEMQFGVTSYWDMLMEHAFGNYRDLLKAVSLHPVMGVYLSSVRNEKADPSRNIRPDENYARELMQLFTIGVYRLNMDGTLMLDQNQQPIPNYDQQDIENFARIFTGWNFAGLHYWNDWPGDYPDVSILPMEAWSHFHDSGEKILLNGQVVPAGGTPESDLEAALDNLFNHPNIAPFISKQLIQRLVTSNPSPSYVQRVAEVFNDNGQGVKGDLKAVIKAILLDEEARVGHLMDEHFGKLREPLLRFSHYWRAFHIQPVRLSGEFWNEGTPCAGETEAQSYDYYRVWWGLYDFQSFIGQQILSAPSVFNFYLPDYSPAGPIRDQGLVAPEFQLATENYLVNTANALNSQIQEDSWPDWPWSILDFAQEVQLASDPEALLDHLNLILFNGEMQPDIRAILLDHLQNSDFPGGVQGRLNRARDALSLIAVSPDYLIQH